MVKIFGRKFKGDWKVSSHESKHNNAPIFHINSEYVEPLSTRRIKSLLDYTHANNMNDEDKYIFLEKYGIDMYNVERYLYDVETLNSCLYGDENKPTNAFAAIQTGIVFVSFLIVVAIFRK